jgi:hypothetical protein
LIVARDPAVEEVTTVLNVGGVSVTPLEPGATAAALEVEPADSPIIGVCSTPVADELVLTSGGGAAGGHGVGIAIATEV